MSYRIYADGEEWCEMDSESEATDYADWLVSMPWHAPEAKANNSAVVRLESGDLLYEGFRTDHRPNWYFETLVGHINRGGDIPIRFKNQQPPKRRLADQIQ